MENGKTYVVYNDPQYEGNEIRKEATIDQMKSQLPDSNFNYYGAYSIRENVERVDN